MSMVCLKNNETGSKKTNDQKKLDLVKQQEEEVETRTHVLTTVV